MSPTAPPRQPGTSKLPREDRIQQILDAASAEFGAHGYQAASLARIADRVGVSKALVLTYLGSKDALFAACARRAGTRLIDGIEQVITEPQPPLQMAQATLSAIFTALEGRPQDWNVINDRSAPAGSDSAEVATGVRRKIAEQASRGIRSLNDLAVLDGEDDLAVLTDVWMGAVTSIVNWWVRRPDRSATEMSLRCERILTALTTSQSTTPG
jgi:AcrR family transcriptional regulator